MTARHVEQVVWQLATVNALMFVTALMTRERWALYAAVGVKDPIQRLTPSPRDSMPWRMAPIAFRGPCGCARLKPCNLRPSGYGQILRGRVAQILLWDPGHDPGPTFHPTFTATDDARPWVVVAGHAKADGLSRSATAELRLE